MQELKQQTDRGDMATDELVARVCGSLKQSALAVRGPWLWAWNEVSFIYLRFCQRSVMGLEGFWHYTVPILLR
jgi:hypothetical protein